VDIYHAKGGTTTLMKKKRKKIKNATAKGRTNEEKKGERIPPPKPTKGGEEDGSREGMKSTFPRYRGKNLMNGTFQCTRGNKILAEI